MSKMRFQALTTLVQVFALALLSGCSRGVFLEQAPWEVDTVRVDGRMMIADTKRNWDMFEPVVIQRVEEEKRGDSPPKTQKDWPAFWAYWISHLRKDQANPDRYIKLIIEKRSEQNLPSIPEHEPLPYR